MKILKAEDDDHRRIYHLTDRIFKVAAIELNHPDDMIPWIELNELIDRIDYNYDNDVISEIRKEARLLLDYRRNENDFSFNTINNSNRLCI